LSIFQRPKQNPDINIITVPILSALISACERGGKWEKVGELVKRKHSLSLISNDIVVGTTSTSSSTTTPQIDTVSEVKEMLLNSKTIGDRDGDGDYFYINPSESDSLFSGKIPADIDARFEELRTKGNNKST